jgi:chromosome segregation ATPase
VPLAAYYGFLARSLRATGHLSHHAVDSVYYFGFLITVGALSVCAFRISSSPEEDTQKIVLEQFAAGLIATGLAVVARVHLSGAVPSTDGDAPAERYIRRCEDLINVVDDAVGRTRHYSEALQKHADAMTERASRSGEQLLGSIESFSARMGSVLAPLEANLTGMRALIEDKAFASHRDAFAEGLKAAGAEVTRLHDVLSGAARAMSEGTASQLRMNQVIAQAADALPAFGAALLEVSGENGAFAASATTTKATAEELSKTTQALAKTCRRLGEFNEAVERSRPAFDALEANAARSKSQLDALGRGLELLDVAIARLTASAEATRAFRVELENAGTALGSFASGTAAAASAQAHEVGRMLDIVGRHCDSVTASTEAAQRALMATTQTIRDSVARSAAELANDVRTAGEAATLMTESLSSVAVNIMKATGTR